MGKDGGARFGEFRRARLIPVEQRDAELLLEIGDSVAHGRNRPPKPLGRRREAARLDDGQEHPELIDAGKAWLGHFKYPE
ncbi:MAG: hypothetical protein WDN69_22105 [Aliidongia sp.]